MYKYGRVDIRSLQQILGNESIATTEIYTHINEHNMSNCMDNENLYWAFLIQLWIKELFCNLIKIQNKCSTNAH